MASSSLLTRHVLPPTSSSSPSFHSCCRAGTIKLPQSLKSNSQRNFAESSLSLPLRECLRTPRYKNLDLKLQQRWRKRSPPIPAMAEQRWRRETHQILAMAEQGWKKSTQIPAMAEQQRWTKTTQVLAMAEQRLRTKTQISAMAERGTRCESILSDEQERGGFREGLGLGIQLQQRRKRGGERGEVRAMAQANRRLSTFPDREGDAKEKFVSLPLIGELPVTDEYLKKVFTPMKIFVWMVIVTVVSSLWGVVSARTVYNPLFWMYSSWILIIWPWPAAILVAFATVRTAIQARNRQPKEWEQVLLLLGCLTWLILVPLGCFHGFVDGWPLVLFVIYIGFFLLSAVVRYRLYGDLEVKGKDKQWETVPSRIWQVGFVACVVGGHWLAAYEAEFLLFSWNFGWKTALALGTIGLAGLTHYTAAHFLGKYFDRLVKPTAVVMFGPYRVVRHPIYASYMMLFTGFCLALRSYKSCLLLLATCVVYYEQRTKLEEDMLVEEFGDLYEEYRGRVRNKYFPFIY